MIFHFRFTKNYKLIIGAYCITFTKFHWPWSKFCLSMASLSPHFTFGKIQLQVGSTDRAPRSKSAVELTSASWEAIFSQLTNCSIVTSNGLTHFRLGLRMGIDPTFKSITTTTTIRVWHRKVWLFPCGTVSIDISSSIGARATTTTS